MSIKISVAVRLPYLTISSSFTNTHTNIHFFLLESAIIVRDNKSVSGDSDRDSDMGDGDE